MSDSQKPSTESPNGPVCARCGAALPDWTSASAPLLYCTYACLQQGADASDPGSE